MEPLTLYERLESLYQQAWRFQLQHGDRLEPWERGGLAQILQELTYDLDKLAATLDANTPWVRPPRPTDPPEVLLQLAERAVWLASVTSRLAEHALWLAARRTALAERALRDVEPLLRLAQGALHSAEEAGGLSPSGRKPEPVPRSSTAMRGRSRMTGG